jgi:hypothetical protein
VADGHESVDPVHLGVIGQIIPLRSRRAPPALLAPRTPANPAIFVLRAAGEALALLRPSLSIDTTEDEETIA